MDVVRFRAQFQSLRRSWHRTAGCALAADAIGPAPKRVTHGLWPGRRQVDMGLFGQPLVRLTAIRELPGRADAWSGGAAARETVRVRVAGE